MYRNYLLESSILQGLTVVFLFPAFCVAASRLFYFEQDLVRAKRFGELFVYRWFLLNGIALQVTFVAMNLIIDTAVLLSITISTPPAVELASIVSLAVLSLLTIMYAVVDVTIMQLIFRKVISPYLVLAWSLGTILAKNGNTSQTSTVMSLCIASSTIVSLILKTAIGLYKPFRRKDQEPDVYEESNVTDRHIQLNSWRLPPMSSLKPLSDSNDILPDPNMTLLSRPVNPNQKRLTGLLFGPITTDKSCHKSINMLDIVSRSSRSLSDPFLNKAPT